MQESICIGGLNFQHHFVITNFSCSELLTFQKTVLSLDNGILPSSIFLEENNDSDFLDLNTIIYGHNMLNGSKFSDINALVSGDISVEDVVYVYLYLPDGRVLIYQIVSAQVTDIYSEIYHLPVQYWCMK